MIVQVTDQNGKTLAIEQIAASGAPTLIFIAYDGPGGPSQIANELVSQFERLAGAGLAELEREYRPSRGLTSFLCGRIAKGCLSSKPFTDKALQSWRSPAIHDKPKRLGKIFQ